jgi:hypothetical protein
MRKTLVAVAVLTLLAPLAAHAQTVTLEDVSAALGAGSLRRSR